MKKFTLLFITVMLVTNFMNAQTLTFKFANPTVIQGTPDVFQFDVEIRASATNTFQRDLQIYFDYNTTAFGADIVANGKISVTPLSLMEPYGLLPNNYIVVNTADNTSSKFAVITEANYEMGELPSATYFNEVPTTYEGLLRFAIEIDDNTELAGISFDELLMNGGQYYQDTDPGPPTTPIPTKYADPNSYENDLLDWDLIPQTLSGTLGWNIWSTYMNPVDPDMVAIFAPIVANVIIVKDGAGAFYIPGVWNGIGLHTVGEGYQVNLSAASTLDVYGSRQIPEMTPFDIPVGWSLLGYLRNTSDDITVMLASIQSSIVIVKNSLGSFWIPGVWNGIGPMDPGQGYQIQLSSAVTGFTYPANSKSMYAGFTPEFSNHYIGIVRTDVNHSLLIPDYAWDVMPDEGDEIGVFDSEDNMVGSGVVQDGFAQVAIWGDDSSTEGILEYMSEGERFNIKTWNYAKELEHELVVTAWEVGSSIYEDHGISIAKSVEKSALGTDGQSALNSPVLYQNVPNPFNNSSTISFFIPEETKVELLMYDVYGNLVDVLTSQVYEQGTYKVELSSREYRTGTYIYKLVTNNYTDTKFMIVQ